MSSDAFLNCVRSLARDGDFNQISSGYRYLAKMRIPRPTQTYLRNRLPAILLNCYLINRIDLNRARLRKWTANTSGWLWYAEQIRTNSSNFRMLNFLLESAITEANEYRS